MPLGLEGYKSGPRSICFGQVPKYVPRDLPHPLTLLWLSLPTLLTLSLDGWGRES